MVRIHVQRTIAASPERVFDWLADPINLTAARLMLRARWSDASTPGTGAVREAIAAGMWLREEITAYDAPRSYSYRIVRSIPPLDHEGGTVSCSPSGDGTHVDWTTTYTHPVRTGGKVLEALTAPLLRSGFVQILAGCAKALEG
ncbi:SRPBCC family protein [Mycolicibacterium hodleri]|uniref:SRPBCC family protein n=1 Tax=Mycolicibacterium hodleri TaxID=49897 RepID=A0A502DZ84_9MYCO|nr:SRPBCC family protein [Mycolicibacterium hodleri]TPG29586.1 SRPBCC family protein [Mycolicibacterium hodleri]